MVLLSLDQSSRTTGYAIFINNNLANYGVIQLEDSNLGTRLFQLKQQLIELINKYNPDEVVFEDIQLQDNIGNNVATFKSLACVYGIVEELFTELKIDHSAIASGTWKDLLGIKGKARVEQKKNAAEYVETKYNVRGIQDIADAICIGEAHIKNTACAW